MDSGRRLVWGDRSDQIQVFRSGEPFGPFPTAVCVNSPLVGLFCPNSRIMPCDFAGDLSATWGVSESKANGKSVEIEVLLLMASGTLQSHELLARKNSILDPAIKSGQESNRMSSRRPRLWLALGLIVAAGLAVRVAALAHWGTGAIESEGAEYTRIAENLRNGVGYVGMVSPGPQLVFNPLFPLLIAGTSYVSPDYERAGRPWCFFSGLSFPCRCLVLHRVCLTGAWDSSRRCWRYCTLC